MSREKTQKYIVSFVMFLVLLFLSYLILKDVTWEFGDDQQMDRILFDKKTLFGWKGHGRFWPLGLFDYNILRLLPDFRSPFPFFVYNILVMSVSLLVWFRFVVLLNKNNWLLGLFGALILVSSSSFFKIHMNCYYAEHFLFLTLSLFLFYYWKGQHAQSTKYYLIALICAVYSTYCKEPIFGIFAIIGMVNLIFARDSLTKKDKIFNWLLLANSAVYLLVYARCCYFIDGFLNNLYSYDPTLNGKTFFNASPEVILYVLRRVIENAPLFVVLSIFGIIRAYSMLIKKDRGHLFVDSVLFGAIGYGCAFIIMLFSGSWYFFPPIVLGIPVLIYWLVYYLKNYRVASIPLLILVMYTAGASAALSISCVRAQLDFRVSCARTTQRIMSEYNKGRPLFFFGNDCYIFGGVNFCLNTQLLKNKHVLQKTTEMGKIPDNALVVVPKESTKEIMMLKSAGFKISDSPWRVNIFSKMP